MNHFKFKYVVMVAFLYSGCGRNNGTPNYTPSPGDNANARPKIEGLDLAQTLLSQSGHWRLKTTWMNGPQFSPEQPIENKLQLFFVTREGAAVDVIKDVTFVPFMPEHGHGIGKRKPTITIGELGVADVSGLWFPMVGKWQFTVKATVNDVTDTAVFNAEVTLK